MQGHAFTWSNRRDGEDFIEENLDCVLASDSWMHLFPNACVNNLIWDGSDHFPLILNLCPDVDNTPGQNTKFFRFEARWQHEEGFDDKLKDFWNEARYAGSENWVDWVKTCGENKIKVMGC